jgi:EAL domain-containing protein (putative c-di-GMP-specific phosphodiesterase class I)
MADSFKRHFKKGDVIVREGEKGDFAYMLESGNVEIVMEREGKPMRIGTRGAGSIIGEMALIDDRPRTATVRATDDCEAIEISRDDFSRRLQSADPILQMTMRLIMTRYRDLLGRSQLVEMLPPSVLSAEEAENSDKLHDITINAIKIHNELKIALHENQLALFYQPIIDLQNMKIAGFEALMRWKHPQKGMISPGVFIPVAEESGLIVEMSRWALGVACDAINALQPAVNPALAGPHPLFISVNFSVKDFSDGDFFDHVQNTLREKKTDAAHIHLEITESLLMAAPNVTKEALERCRQHGIHISIDDFGTGYSSLAYLHSFPINTLKIDQSFVRSMNANAGSLMLVKSIIALARNLGMKLIAEGIESEKEAAIIRDLGCEECQGFWFAKPMPLEDAMNFVKSWNPPKIS